MGLDGGRYASNGGLEMKVRFVVDIEINQEARERLEFDSALGNMADALGETIQYELANEFGNDLLAPYNAIGTIMDKP